MSSKEYFSEQGSSIYFDRPEDPRAVYVTPHDLPVKSGGFTDITDALQNAINQVKYNFGIVFIKDGIYKITETIYIPKAIRLIGYGKNRPLIVLGENTPGFQAPDPDDKGQASYMFWFTNSVPQPEQSVEDANPGTFYSAMFSRVAFYDGGYLF